MNKRSYNSIVCLTGAGISAESGIQTFRDQNGLWENHAIEDVATPDAFAQNPNFVHNFYNERRISLFDKKIEPNLAHQALSKCEKKFIGEFIIITQNIDNLHERAGSKNILHMHGELTKMRCEQTNQVFKSEMKISTETKCQCCQQAGTLRPHIVWFGEIPHNMDIIEQKLMECDLFISIGTSGAVYPAAMFVQQAKIFNDAYTVEVNTQETEISDRFDETIQGPATLELPKFLESILNKV